VYVLINGAFGVGKTSVTRELEHLVPGSVVFDPERIGFVLRRLPGYRRSDYQHLRSWRRLTILGIRLAGAFRRVVLVPMAISEVRYLEELREGLASRGRPVLHFCLTAPLPIVRARLETRGEARKDPRWAWVHRRAAECCTAHASSAFAVHVDAADPSARAIAVDLAGHIARATA